MVPGHAAAIKNGTSNDGGRMYTHTYDEEGPQAAQPGSPRQTQVNKTNSRHKSVASASNLSDNDVVEDIGYVLKLGDPDIEGGEGAVTRKSNINATGFDQYDNNDNDDNDNYNDHDNNAIEVEQSKSSSHHSDSEIFYNNDNNNNDNGKTAQGATTDGSSKGVNVASPKGKTSGNISTRGKRTRNATRKGTRTSDQLDNVNDMDDVDVEDMYDDENIVDETNGKTTQV